MKTLRVATLITGAITVIAIVAPLMSSGGSSGDLSGLVGFIFGWLIVAPVAGVVTICLGAWLSVISVRAEGATRGTRWGLCSFWAVLLALAIVWLVAAQHGPLGDTPLSGIPTVFTVFAGLAVIAVAIAAYSASVKEAPARTRMIRWVAFGALASVAIGACLFFITKQSLLAEYGREAGVAVVRETTLQESQRSETVRLATACIALPAAKQRIEETAFYEGVQPPVLPEELATELRARHVDAAAGIAAFDPSVCESAAAYVKAEIAANGENLDDLEWSSSFLANDIDKLLPPDEAPLPQTPSLWAVSGADVAAARARSAAAMDALNEVHEVTGPIAEDAANTVSRPFGLISGKMRDAMAGSAAAVIAEVGTTGTTEAGALLDLTGLSYLGGATDSEIYENFSSYLRSAIAMLEGAG